MLKRVVITGMGVLSPTGSDIRTFWNNTVNGVRTASTITRFDASLFRTQFANQLQNFDAAAYLDKTTIKRTDLFTQYALIASDQAIKDSGFDFPSMNPFDVGVIWGSGQGGMDTFEEQVKEYVLGNGQPRFSPFLIPKFIPNMSSGMISIRNGYMGINYTTISACATSNTAIMDAFNYIRLGKAKIIVTGGSEAPITPASFGGFSAMKAMSHRNDDPGHASRPFDLHRDGFVMAEGAGALVLEDYDHAVKRGAKIYGEVVGASMTSDAYHMTATHPEGLGAIQAMKFALEEAGLTISDVNYLNPHATSTPVGDLSETKAITTLTGDQKNGMFISATKSITGHLLGAAGAVEAIIALMAMQENTIPPTINTEEIDPAISGNLNIVINEAVQAPVSVAMSNTFGFGGHNGTVVFRKL
ncbi:beta-ketoacyl-ACP synthase II [Flavihumibacter solisilvae]|uniref:3-oxoacyl-[acyl-carrier-protein] synthase 2 n=1 Tax=Flavihumibacter solisilvae TaxID=1349421 RepID=A0A0C1L8A5_9BACT|nr:beta-ketoacyl-ACP synthase II [Flavihumibacter solisilvae]KIC95841.1 3-oxoacyl-ACP synthase [Flavihumibacter solisilvae]